MSRICINGVIRDMTPEELEELEKNPPHEQAQTQEQQVVTLMRTMVRTATTIPDAVALSIPDMLPTWKELLDEGKQVEADVCLMHEGQCYRVVQAVTPQSPQPPGAEGMLAVYRPIDKEHAGTLEDPIPYVYGMNCYSGKYYSFEGKTYLCNQNMTPCVWSPGTQGLWQWKLVE